MARRFYMKVAVAFLVIAVGATLSAYESQAQGLGTLFATDGSGGNILSLNTTTGAGTDLGFLAIGGVPSVAVDPTTGSMYLGRGGGLPRLYSIDASGLGALGSIDASALVTLVGDTGLGFAAIGSLDFAPDGTLYAAVNIVGDGGTGSDHLATIDPATAATTVIGGFGTCTGVRVPSRGRGSCTLDGIEAIAFDGFGNLWGALRNRNSKGFPPPPPPPRTVSDRSDNGYGFLCDDDSGCFREAARQRCREPAVQL